MRAIILVIVTAATLGAASAQAPFEPQWRDGLSVPSGLYPDAQWQGRQAGEVRLCCPVDDLGRLQCGITAGDPLTDAFNEPAATAAQWLELTEASYAELRAYGDNAAIALQMRFSVADELEERRDDGKGLTIVRNSQPRIEPSYVGLCRGRIVEQPRVRRQN